MDVVEELNKMKQSGSVREYQLRFEELGSLMLSRNPYMTEDYFVSSFISGLSEEFRFVVKMTRPRIVQKAIESALLQELNVEALMKKKRNQGKGSSFGRSPLVGRMQGSWGNAKVVGITTSANVGQQRGRVME